MGSRTTKARNNIYTQARERAAKYNDALRSREGAAEALGLSASTLADYELGLTKVIPADKIVLMSDLYSAPDLMYQYCSSECPIGQLTVQEVEVSELDRMTLKVIHALEEAGSVQDAMLDIAHDGEIDESEEHTLDRIIDQLEHYGQLAKELAVWKERRKR